MRSLLRATLVLALLSAPLLGVALAASPGDRASTEATLADLEKDPATRDVTADAVKRARTALERATRMRASGDETHAKNAEALAHDWAEVGKELARATTVEKKAAEAHLGAADASAQTDRERAMLEQRMAENGRLVAELSQVDGGKDKPITAASDAGTRKDGSK